MYIILHETNCFDIGRCHLLFQQCNKFSIYLAVIMN